MRLRLIGLLLVVGAGCTLTTSLDGLSGGADPTVPDEAGAPDSAVDATTDVATLPDTGVDATIEAGTNLYPTGGFESGVTCSGQGYNSNLFVSDQNPHSGLYSCRVCGRGTNQPPFSFDQVIPMAPVVVGATYRATAWVRKSTADPPPTDVVSIVARSITNPGFAPVENNKSDRLIGTEWRFFSVDFKPTKSADAFDVFVSANYESGTCFVVDDITFVRLD